MMMVSMDYMKENLSQEDYEIWERRLDGVGLG